jgi:rRNA maturation protein Nop10
MGMMPMKQPDECPRCGAATQVRGEIAGVTREVSIDIVRRSGEGEALFVECPVCGGQRHIWDKTSPLRYRAAEQMTDPVDEEQ